MGGAERLWWLLRHFGHDDCAVLDLDAWHGPLRGGEEDIEPAQFVPRERSGDTIAADELAAQLAELVVVDARIPSRWRGEPHPLDTVPGPDSRRAERAVERAAAESSRRASSSRTAARASRRA